MRTVVLLSLSRAHTVVGDLMSVRDALQHMEEETRITVHVLDKISISLENAIWEAHIKRLFHNSKRASQILI